MLVENNFLIIFFTILLKTNIMSELLMQPQSSIKNKCDAFRVVTYDIMLLIETWHRQFYCISEIKVN